MVVALLTQEPAFQDIELAKIITELICLKFA